MVIYVFGLTTRQVIGLTALVFFLHNYLWWASPSPTYDSGLNQDNQGQGKSIDLWLSQKTPFPYLR